MTNRRQTPPPSLSGPGSHGAVVLWPRPRRHRCPARGWNNCCKPASGLALVLLIVGGRPLAPALSWAACSAACWRARHRWPHWRRRWAPSQQPGSACVLLRQPDFDPDHPNFKVIQHVLLWVCGIGAGTGAVVASTGLLLAGEITPSAWTEHLLHGWLSGSLGSLLIAPWPCPTGERCAWQNRCAG